MVGNYQMSACKDIRHSAWNSLSGKWGTAILIYFLMFLITLGLSITVVGGILAAGAFAVGISGFYVANVRSQETSLSNMFSGFSRFGNALLSCILQGLFVFFWSLLFIVPGLIKTYSYAMTYYIMNDDPTIAGDQAITKSRKMMDGYKWKLFLLDLSFIGWYLLGVLTLGILYIWIFPYTNAARAAFYVELKELQNSEQNKTGETVKTETSNA